MTEALFVVAAPRFWAKVAIAGPDECWTWTASRNEHGYGGFRLSKRQLVKAHRMAWLLTHPGESLQPSDHVCHHCDNPPCCNPAHLYKGNVQTNVADMVARDRHSRGRAHAAAVSAKVPRGDAHWTRSVPPDQQPGVKALKALEPWNKGRHDYGDHGTTSRYGQGCRCGQCRQANTTYKAMLRNRSARHG